MLEDGHAYPRPQLQRDAWESLNGVWEFALDPKSEWTAPAAVQWNSTILVPFSPETAASGIHEPGSIAPSGTGAASNGHDWSPDIGFYCTLAPSITRQAYG